MCEVDYIEVGREAHRLSSAFGREAWMYAERWANIADQEGKVEESAFWKAVSASLKPR
jgi:hypothetical protein